MKKKIDFIENLTHRTAQDAGWTVSETITHVFLSYGILLSPPLPGSAEQIPLGGRPKEVRQSLHKVALLKLPIPKEDSSMASFQ